MKVPVKHSTEMDPVVFRTRLMDMADPVHPPTPLEEIKFSGLPMTGFIFGSIFMLTLFFGRVLSILAYFFLPFMSALVVSLAWIAINQFLNDIPKQDSGLISANPPNRVQSTILEALSPFLKYQPPWWCLDNHHTTILPVLIFRPLPSISARQRFAGDDAAPLWLDWRIPVKPIKGIILAIPGLNGSSKGGYVVDLMNRAAEAGLAVAVLKGRGAGRTGVVSIESSFHLGRHGDLMHALVAIESIIVDTNLPVYMVGYSAGAIRAVNFAGVYGDAIKGRIRGIVSLGGLLKNEKTTSSRMSRFAYQPVIVHAFASTMYSKFVPHLKGETEEHFVHRIFHETYYTSFVQYDRAITSRLHNLTVNEYHDMSFVKHEDKWKNIAVPTLIVHARDDPVVHVDDAIVPEIAHNNSFVTYLVTEKGGHIGWPIGLSQSEHGYKWMSDVVLTYISALGL